VRIVRKLAILLPVVGVLYLGGYVFLPYYAVGPGPARDTVARGPALAPAFP